jgi:hypothetical protein
VDVEVVLVEVLVVVGCVVLVVVVGTHPDSERLADALPWGWLLKDQWAAACTECVPDVNEIVMLSVADDPLNVKSRAATWTPSIVTVSCETAVVDSKF